MSRQTRRRRPKRERRGEPVVTSTADTPINHSRLRQIFTNMRGRSFVVSFLPVTSVVQAASPEELVAATEKGPTLL